MGRLFFGSPRVGRGGNVTFRALVDVVVVTSTCPMDQEA